MNRLFFIALLSACLAASSAVSAYSWMDSWQPPVNNKRHPDLLSKPVNDYFLAIVAEHQDPPDYTEAKRWLEQAANQSYAPAQRELGRLYLYGHGVVANPETALAWLQKAIAQQDAAANYVLGEMYLKGYAATPRNLALAARYLETAVQLGFGKDIHYQRIAERDLGILYLRGYGVPRDVVKGKALLQKSAADGDKFSQFILRLE